MFVSTQRYSKAAYEQWREETPMELLVSGFELLDKRLERLEQERRTKNTAKAKREKESLRLLRGYLENN